MRPWCCVFPCQEQQQLELRCCVPAAAAGVAAVRMSTATAGSVVLLSPRMITAAAGVAMSIAATGNVVLLSPRTLTSAAGVAAVSKSIAATAAGSVACAATDGFQDDSSSSSKWWTW